VTEQQLLDLGRHRESDAFTEVEKLVLDYAMALTETPAVVSDELFEQLHKHMTDAQMVELTAVVAFENFLARFNRGFDVQASGFSEGAFCPIPDHAAPSEGR
jgi:alkylhydroperoxidase family enzyme